jgi:hypothetical protein
LRELSFILVDMLLNDIVQLELEVAAEYMVDEWFIQGKLNSIISSYNFQSMS